MRKLTVLAAVAAAAFGAQAHATVLTGAQLAAACSGSSSCSPTAGVTITSSPGAITGNNVGGVQGIGIAGKTDGEIDADEFLTVQFSTPVALQSFRLSAFFNGSEFGDDNERAFVRVLYADNSAAVYQMDVTGENLSTIGLEGGIKSSLGVSNCGETTESGAGCFDYAGSPLSTKLITRLVFTAADKPSTSNNSDYLLAALAFITPTSEIPLPGAILLMASGLAGLGALRRKAKTA